jgi:uncharacterized coiled-coil protein SlyX
MTDKELSDRIIKLERRRREERIIIRQLDAKLAEAERLNKQLRECVNRMLCGLPSEET